MSKYISHFVNCKARKKGKQSAEFLSKQRDAIERRRILRKEASKELTLKRSTIANTSDDAASSREGGRKRAREGADTDPENLLQHQKRRIAKEDAIDAPVAISSDLYHDAPGPEDVARGTGPFLYSRSLLTFP